MKELKNKEVVIGLIAIIVLSMIALALIIRKEIRRNPGEIELPEVVKEVDREETRVPEVREEISEGVTKLPAASEKAPTEEKATNNTIQKVTEKTAEQKEKKNKVLGLYTILGEETYKPSTLIERKEEDKQLEELFTYWDDYHLEAVDDLVHLERIQKISAELNGTNNYYYYGAVDTLGRPHGKGLAVYGNNTYYCGEWKNGLRSGGGMWLQVGIYDETNKNENFGLIEHMYNGQWSRDLPNGEGQEHFGYDYDVLNEKEDSIANVMGTFKDGYYNGEMYVMTVDNQGKSKDWFGTCKKGIWDSLGSKSTLGDDPVWVYGESLKEGERVYYYLSPSKNVKQGIFGLKK